MTDFAEALLSLRPGAQWSLNGDTLAGLVWRDGVQPRPTDAEIMAEAGRLAAIGRPRMATAYELFSALSKTEFAAMESLARKDDARIITTRGGDEIPETNAKLARIAAACGLTVEDWFARLA